MNEDVITILDNFKLRKHSYTFQPFFVTIFKSLKLDVYYCKMAKIKSSFRNLTNNFSIDIVAAHWIVFLSFFFFLSLVMSNNFSKN